MKAAILVSLGALVLAGCGDQASNQTNPVDPEPPLATPASRAVDPVAFGLTEAQLLDADLVDSTGVELGSIEAIERNPAGTVTGLRVEISDTDPDRYVVIPLEGLTTTQTGDDWDLRSDMTRDDLLALPAAQ